MRTRGALHNAEARMPAMRRPHLGKRVGTNRHGDGPVNRFTGAADSQTLEHGKACPGLDPDGHRFSERMMTIRIKVTL
jgi:hypothetical protein